MKILSLVATLFCLGHHAMANLANPDAIVMEQADGSPITLRLKGDEFDFYYTDDAGYTCIPNNKRDWVYAVQGPKGNLITTGVKVGQAIPPGLNKGVRPSAEVKAADCKDKICGGSGNGRRLGAPHRQLALTQGVVKNLVVLIRFSDHTGRTLPTQSDIYTLMNNRGNATLCPTGSVWNVFNSNSYGQLDLQSVVADWVTVPNTEAYYANGNSGLTTRTHELIRDALNLVDSSIDFRDFNKDGNSYIDAITFLHSGYAAEFGGTDAYGAANTNRIWSHKWSVYTLPGGYWTGAESVRVYDYNISPAVWATSGSSIGRIGVIAHELGHFFGLPDLYDGSVGSGIGSYCLMANSWGFDGTQYYPPHMSAWSRTFVGWTTPVTISANGVYTVRAAEVLPSVTVPQIYKITYNFPLGEYLLIENRQKLNFDAVMPDSGLAIFHIDDAASYTTEGYPGLSGWPGNGQHYQVAMLQADALYHLEKGTNRGGSKDLFFQGGASSQLLPSTNVLTGPFPNTDSYKGGTVSYSKSYAKSYSTAYSKSYAKSYSTAYSKSYCAKPYFKSYAKPYSNSYAKSYSTAYFKSYCTNAYFKSYAKPYSNSYAKSYSTAYFKSYYANAYSNSYAKSYSNAYSKSYYANAYSKAYYTNAYSKAYNCSQVLLPTGGCQSTSVPRDWHCPMRCWYELRWKKEVPRPNLLTKMNIVCEEEEGEHLCEE